MVKSNASKRSLECCRRRNRIHFDDNVQEECLTQAQIHTIQSIRKLGRTDFAKYAVSAVETLIKAPWKFETVQVAINLVEAAHTCVGRNEATWRTHCERLVFARACSEVACLGCRQRIWRSEIEATFKSNRGGQAQWLKSRQANGRGSCYCDKNLRGMDRIESKGTTRIFIDRAEDNALHSTRFARDSGIKILRPDRVFGLRETRLFQESLQARARTSSTSSTPLVKDRIRVSSHSPEGDQLLFPFFYYEAKSGISAGDWDSIKLQTCVPVAAALMVQRKLKLKCDGNAKRMETPLVWFLMSRGENWKLCVAYVTERVSADGCDHHIANVWNGTITERDGALQLLLIIDHIFDWARDIYRPNIITQIRSLAAGPDMARSTISESVVFSTKQCPRPTPIEAHGSGGNLPRQTEAVSYHHLDSKWGNFRDCSSVESTYRCVFITKDNISTLMSSMEKCDAEKLARQVISQLTQNPLSISHEALSEVENLWTSNDRPGALYINARSNFCTAITLSYYISLTWDMIRELTVIAVEHDAFESLVGYSGLKKDGEDIHKPEMQTLEPGVLHTELMILKNEPRSKVLFRSIRRSQSALKVFTESEICRKSAVSDSEDISGPRTGTGSWYEFQEGFSTARDTVEFVYRMFKKGRCEPKEPFIRSSAHLDTIADVNEERTLETCVLDPIPKAPGVLVHGSLPQNDSRSSEYSDVCLFVMADTSAPKEENTLRNILRNLFENYDVYHTKRDNCKPILAASNQTSQGRWNLEETYSIYTLGSEFYDWIGSFGYGPPDSQGAIRAPSSSVRDVLLRRELPWKQSYFDIEEDRYKRAYMARCLIMEDIRYWGHHSNGKIEDEKAALCCECCGSTEGVESIEPEPEKKSSNASSDESSDEFSGESSDELDTKKSSMCSSCKGLTNSENLPEWLKEAWLGKRLHAQTVSGQTTTNKRRNDAAEIWDQQSIAKKFGGNLDDLRDRAERFEKRMLKHGPPTKKRKLEVVPLNEEK